MISFRLFDLEADPTCRYDYLDVYNGHSRLVQKLGRFCGTFRPGALISTSNTMMLEMVSDDGTGGRGFLAYFSAGKPHVEGAEQEIPEVLTEFRSSSAGSSFKFLWRRGGVNVAELQFLLFPQRTSSVVDG